MTFVHPSFFKLPLSVARPADVSCAINSNSFVLSRVDQLWGDFPSPSTVGGCIIFGVVAGGGFGVAVAGICSFWDLDGCFRLGVLCEAGLAVGRIAGLGSGGRLRGGGRISGSSEFIRFGSIMLLYILEYEDVVMCVECVEWKTAFGNRGEAVSKNQ